MAQKKTQRRSGVLLHITSLPSRFGVGSIGAEARWFADFLKSAGQTCWQILPLCPTGFGDSPYQSYSTFAGNTNLIDLGQLIDDGLLTEAECEEPDWGDDPAAADFDKVAAGRAVLLRRAAERLLEKKPDDYDGFCAANAEWLDDYALFMALKRENGGRPWYEWEPKLKKRDPKTLAAAKKRLEGEIAFHKTAQYIFFSQWRALKDYVNGLGIEIIGDLPIYVAMDSADVWADPELFFLDETLTPIEVAGCPPDCFTADGQLWGNPLYDWEAMRAYGYEWWIRRITACRALYDLIRIDHFRGFSSYYCIPYGMPNARIGHWRKGPGMELFRAIRESHAADGRIIAEDLGFLDDDVRKLLRDSGCPGMKVLQFAFDPDGDSDYLPHNYPQKCIVYTGTHDNDTTLGWAAHASRRELRFAKQYTRASRSVPLNWAMITTALASTAQTAVTPMQDLLGLGSEARMNTPSTVGCNWKWRMLPGAYTDELAAKLRGLCELYRRVPKRSEKPAKKRGK